jgi:hypothetical protein
MMRRLFVLTSIMLFGCFSVVLGSVGAVLGCLPMMVGSRLRHSVSFREIF